MKMGFQSNLFRAQRQEGVGQNFCDYIIVYSLNLVKGSNTVQLGEKNQWDKI